MRQKSQTRQTGAAKAIKDIRRATRKQYAAEEKIRIVLDGLRGEETIAGLCRRESIAQSIYPGFPRWMTNLMTCFADSAIRINAIPSALRANPMSPGG